MLVFDLETNGYLEDVHTIHCLAIKDTATGSVMRYRGNEVEDGARVLMEATLACTVVAGHNAIGYDVPVLFKMFDWFRVDWKYVWDTLNMVRLIYPDIKESDYKRYKKGTLPGQMIGRHSLESWGYRLGNYKGDFKGPWDTWTQEMDDYCLQDVEVTAHLLEVCMSKGFSQESFELEFQVQRIINRQTAHGFLFDKEAAVKLYAKLVQRREELSSSLATLFPPFYKRDGEIVPKRDNKKMGYVQGAKLSKVKLTDFNPVSRDHVALVLKRKYNWEPTEFTKDGKPTVDDAVLGKLPYPEARLLAETFLVGKRIGQLAEGNEAWLKHVGPDGRIHGRLNTNGAVTGRMTHFHPNMGQAPAVRSLYGGEMRAMFIVPPGKVLVGCDADGIELRNLAGYMAKYDKGAYVRVVLLGDKDAGTDSHSVNCRALGMEPTSIVFVDIDPNDKSKGRDVAKTWFYAFIYGAGDELLGVILIKRTGSKARKRGKEARATFLNNLPALKKLSEAVKKRAGTRGYLKGLDGRKLRIRSQHAALNALLQSAGAIIMKRALCILDDDLQAAGLVPGVHYEFCANVHDEWQIEVDADKGDTVGKIAAEAIRKAGEYYNFPCPMSGSYVVGKTWAETH